MEEYKTTELLLEVEEERIINSIVKCVRRDDMRYLLPNAFKWLTRLNGLQGFGKWNWDRFTENVSTQELVGLLLQHQNSNRNDSDENTRYSRYYAQREGMYGSIIRILERDEADAKRLADKLSGGV